MKIDSVLDNCSVSSAERKVRTPAECVIYCALDSRVAGNTRPPRGARCEQKRSRLERIGKTCTLEFWYIKTKLG